MRDHAPTLPLRGPLGPAARAEVRFDDRDPLFGPVLLGTVPGALDHGELRALDAEGEHVGARAQPGIELADHDGRRAADLRQPFDQRRIRLEPFRERAERFRVHAFELALHALDQCFGHAGVRQELLDHREHRGHALVVGELDEPVADLLRHRAGGRGGGVHEDERPHLAGYAST